jgi:hypothetical protein
MSHPTLARHADLTSKEIGPVARHSCRCIREMLVQFDPLEMEIGPRLDRRVAMCPMLLFRLPVPALCWRALHRMAASAVHCIVPVTVETLGLKFQLLMARAFSTSSSRPTAQLTSAHSTVFGKALMAV